MTKPGSGLFRIFLETAGLIALHVLLLRVLAHARLLEHLLAPGSRSYWAIVATVAFLLFRAFLYLLGPSWFICRLWLWYSRPEVKDRATKITVDRQM